MRTFRITDRRPERPWRKRKNYTAGELRWLAKRQGLLFRHHKKRIELTKPDGRGAINFLEVSAPESARPANDRLATFAALRQ